MKLLDPLLEWLTKSKTPEDGARVLPCALNNLILNILRHLQLWSLMQVGVKTLYILVYETQEIMYLLLALVQLLGCHSEEALFPKNLQELLLLIQGLSFLPGEQTQRFHIDSFL